MYGQPNFSQSAQILLATGTIGALGNALLDAYNPRTTSRAWLEKLEKLEEAIRARPGEIIADRTELIGGIPTYMMYMLKRNVRVYSKIKDYLGRPYLLSAKYRDISDLNVGKSYYFYLMPKDEDLIDIFLLLNNASNSTDEKIKNIFENVAVIAFS